MFILRKFEQTNDSDIGGLLIYFGHRRYTPRVRREEPKGKRGEGDEPEGKRRGARE